MLTWYLLIALLRCYFSAIEPRGRKRGKLDVPERDIVKGGGEQR